MKNKFKLHGVVTDFRNNVLEGALVRLINDKFEDLYVTYTDKDGRYEIEAEEGLYYTFFACKEYKIKYLEFWGWNIPLFRDMELNARIDGLEIYGVNAFKIQVGNPLTLSLYFRPMSLSRGKALEKESNLKSLEIIDISPKLKKEDIKVSINDKEIEVLEINKVLEYGGENEDITQHIYSYLIQTKLPKNYKEVMYDYNKIDIVLNDRETGEQGEGTVFWKYNKTMHSIT